ncbi:NADH-quinone oxidoreductase subunit D [Martelella alba]|uniref:NADH-quinone oxidoreductase subunit D n=2 Tax=Martelella alba TaxID=2590451 RepID=A0ABY2SG05_9HYPH|nr:NADH-quinone oxidoreductase subunit D [Martelella alba]
MEYLPVTADSLAPCLEALLESGGRMQMAYVWFPEPDRPEVRYLAAGDTGAPLQMWICPAADGCLPSLAISSPLLGWYEREMQDLYGLTFTGHPQPFPLVAAGAEAPARLSPRVMQPALRAPLVLPSIDDPLVQLLNFGPVRADVMESGQFQFFYLGESIAHYQPRLFFKHRGMESRFAAMNPLAATVLAERVSGVGGVAHALAYCEAVEDAAGCAVPVRARRLRTLLAELERIYNHLHFFGLLADTTTLKVGQAEGRLLEEDVKQLAGRLTGHRLMHNLLTPGGLRRDLALPDEFAATTFRLYDRVKSYLGQLSRTTSYQDRLLGTGPLSREVAFDQGATGPVERASGLDRDLRRDHPYAAYGELEVKVAGATAGDAHARAVVRALELRESFHVIRRLLADLPPGDIHADCVIKPDSCGLGWAESPRGSLYYAIHLDAQGRLARVKIKSPSFSNWRVFPFTVSQSNMMDYAINEASFGLTIAGCDR